nr:uncharacterized protein CTRU02_14707 [Colletotrichum truncatum]KAF6781923.1 hypothetical protein CTRU02_14707 [Colletotrichum truncatum]
MGSKQKEAMKAGGGGVGGGGGGNMDRARLDKDGGGYQRQKPSKSPAKDKRRAAMPLSADEEVWSNKTQVRPKESGAGVSKLV